MNERIYSPRLGPVEAQRDDANISALVSETVEYSQPRTPAETIGQERQKGRRVIEKKSGGFEAIDFDDNSVFVFNPEGRLQTIEYGIGGETELFAHDDKGRISEKKIISPDGKVLESYRFLYKEEDPCPEALTKIFIIDDEGNITDFWVNTSEILKD